MDYIRSDLHLRRRRKEISETFHVKRKIALKKTILRDLIPNCGPLAGVGGGTNPPNLPPAYAHAVGVGGGVAGGAHLTTSISQRKLNSVAQM